MSDVIHYNDAVVSSEVRKLRKVCVQVACPASARARNGTERGRTDERQRVVRDIIYQDRIRDRCAPRQPTELFTPTPTRDLQPSAFTQRGASAPVRASNAHTPASAAAGAPDHAENVFAPGAGGAPGSAARARQPGPARAGESARNALGAVPATKQ
jgi:hypothetical protein